MQYFIKEYLKDLKVILALCLALSCVISIPVFLGGRPDRLEMNAFLFAIGLLHAGGVLAVTVDHVGKWNTIRSEHYAPSSVESIDMEQLHQRIEEVQNHDER